MSEAVRCGREKKQKHEIPGLVFVNPGGVRSSKNELRIENDVFFYKEFEFFSDSFRSFHLTPKKHVFHLKNTFFRPKMVTFLAITFFLLNGFQ